MRKTIFWIHLAVGILAGVVIMIMSVTGVLLMYQRQITAWADDVSVQPPSAEAKRLPVEALLTALREKETNAPTAITISSDPHTAASVSFGREKTVFLDPYTGAILGEGSKATREFFHLMIDWHRWLGMHGENREIGKAITGAANLGFLFLVASGFYLWWPRHWSRKALSGVTFLNGSLTGKARDWNWHNVFGFWSAIPLAIVVFTAVFFSYPWATDLLYKATGSRPPARPAGPPGTRGGQPPRAREAEPRKPVDLSGLNASWARAEELATGWRTINLRLPNSPGAPLSFSIDRGNGARPDLRSQLTLDSKKGEEKWETYAGYEPARKIRLWVRWLHTGEAGGFVGQTIAGLASAAGAILVWTGFSLSIRRFFGKQKPVSAPQPQLESVS